nr:hypothetical protein [Paraflavitalea speifideiaquila]
MKQLLCFISGFILISFVTHAQVPDETAVANQVNLFNKAIVATDTATLRQLSLPQLSFGHSSGKVEDQSTFVSNVKKARSFSVDRCFGTNDLVLRQQCDRSLYFLRKDDTGWQTRRNYAEGVDGMAKDTKRQMGATGTPGG